jgi:hypothetical protein
VQHHADLAGDRHRSALETEALDKTGAPGLQRRAPLYTDQESGCRLEQVGAQQRVAALGDPGIPVDLAGLVAPGCQAEIGTDRT